MPLNRGVAINRINKIIISLGDRRLFLLFRFVFRLKKRFIDIESRELFHKMINHFIDDLDVFIKTHR